MRALRRCRLPHIRAVCAPPARSRTIWTIWQWNQATVPVPSGRSSHSWAGSFLKAQARRGAALTFREDSREPWGGGPGGGGCLGGGGGGGFGGGGGGG